MSRFADLESNKFKLLSHSYNNPVLGSGLISQHVAMARRGSRGKAGERFAAWLEFIRLSRFNRSLGIDELKVDPQAGNRQPGKVKNRISSD